MRIASLKVDRWSQPDGRHQISYLGMARRGEIFRQLRDELGNMGLLPDEYFLNNGSEAVMEAELPDYDYAQPGCEPLEAPSPIAHLFCGMEQALKSVYDKLRCGLNSSQKAD